MNHHIQPLINDRDSCYIDSLLVALFADPSPYIKKHILTPSPTCVDDDACNGDISYRIQDEIRRVAYLIAVGKATSVQSLRRMIKKCPKLNAGERFDITGMNDPSIFFDMFMLKVFPCLTIPSKGQEVCPDCNQKVDVVDKTNLLIPLETGPLDDIDGLLLSTIVKEQNLQLIFPDFVIFDLIRKDPGYRDDIVVVPDREMTVGLSGMKNTLRLKSLVVWEDYHYTAYCLVDGVWNYYDDTEDRVEVIGTYMDMLHSNPNPMTSAKLYVYSRDERNERNNR